MFSRHRRGGRWRMIAGFVWLRGQINHSRLYVFSKVETHVGLCVYGTYGVDSLYIFSRLRGFFVCFSSSWLMSAQLCRFASVIDLSGMLCGTIDRSGNIIDSCVYVCAGWLWNFSREVILSLRDELGVSRISVCSICLINTSEAFYGIINGSDIILEGEKQTLGRCIDWSYTSVHLSNM